MKSKLRVATLLLTLGVASSACGTTYRADLQSLQGDPMAAPDVPGAELARSSEVHAEAGATGKATQAHFTAAYSVPAGGDKASVQREAVQQAQAAGWAIEDPDAEIVVGTKRLATGEAEIGIYFVDEEGEQVRAEIPQFALLSPMGLQD